MLKLRKHDYQFGWFTRIAEIHGRFSQERKQAKAMMDMDGQYYWPGIAPTMEISTGNVTSGPIAMGRFNQIAKEMSLKPWNQSTKPTDTNQRNCNVPEELHKRSASQPDDIPH